MFVIQYVGVDVIDSSNGRLTLCFDGEDYKGSKEPLIMVCLGGIAAQALYILGKGNDANEFRRHCSLLMEGAGSSDMRYFRALAGGDPQVSDDPHVWLQQVRGILQDKWENLMRLAEALIEHRGLLGARARIVYDGPAE